MSGEMTNDWLTDNQHSLMKALEKVRLALERKGTAFKGEGEKSDDSAADNFSPDSAADSFSEPSALKTLCVAFGLSSFERDLLLLGAGPELDGKFVESIARAQGNPSRAYPTFGLALAALPEPHWSALAPGSPLRRWRLVEVGNGDALMTSPLRVDERVLHYLTGVNSLDERLQGLMQLVTPERSLAHSQQEMAQKIAGVWRKPVSSGRQPVILLCGSGGEDKRAVAAVSCAALGLHMYAIRSADIPAAASERETLARLWEREAILSNSALLVEAENSEETELQRSLIPFLQTLQGFALVSRRDPLQNSGLSFLRCDVNKPVAEEQKIIWEEALGPLAQPMNGHLDRLVNQFSFGYQRIKTIGATSVNQAAGSEENELPGRIWEICRDQSRPRLDDLAQRLEPRVAWDDLVLPREQLRMLKEIAAQVRHRSTVYQTWKFAEKETRGLGISALFTGASGTGKTLAAEVMASELRLDLYRIDLSQVVNKYIGETEKNLRRVFEAAEDGGAILLFDEADALFGKRSEVKDSHDRFANIEVSYLLQRMESYRGLAILTTNMKEAIDPGFLRRIRFVVHFPFPDANARTEIWRRVFPATLPTQDLAIEKLARLSVAGGNIRNIALNAAFLAADAGEPVRMNHLLQAAQFEYSKLEKPLTEAEIRGWV
jgi:hypothetical protein